MIKKIHYKPGDTEGWLELRNSLSDKMGGSEVGNIANHNKYSSFFKMLCERVGLLEPEDISGKMAVKLGHFNEPFVAMEFERVSGKKVHNENCIFLNDKYPHLKATIDRKVTNEESGLECKFMSDMSMRRYKRGEFPETYKDQCVVYLAVTGLKRWYLSIVTNSTLYVYLMTTEKAEEARYYALKEKYGFPADCSAYSVDTDPEYAEWVKDWKWLDATYYLDSDEMEGAEIVAAHFVDCVNQINGYMADKTFANERERLAFLQNAIYQVVDPADIDGSEITADTIYEMSPIAEKDSVIELGQDTDKCKELETLVEERAKLKRDMSEIEEASDRIEAQIDEVENKIKMKFEETETLLLPQYKLTYKNGAARRSCSVDALTTYFANKGEEVPDGLITTSTPKRTLKVSIRKEKKAKKSKAA